MSGDKKLKRTRMKFTMHKKWIALLRAIRYQNQHFTEHVTEKVHADLRVSEIPFVPKDRARLEPRLNVQFG